MEEKIPTYDETTEVSDIPSYDETSAVDEVAASSKKKVDALNSSAGTLSMDVLRPENNPTQEPKTSKEEALNAVVAKSQAGYINPDLEDFNKPQVTNQTAKKETPIDDLVLTNRTLRQMRNFSENTTAKATADLERIKQEGITLRDQYNSNPSYDLEQKMFSKEVEYKAAEKKANLSALQREVYNRRLMETSESIKKMANDKVPDGIYSAIYKGIKGNVKDTEKAIEMSRASKAEQIQWAKDEALKAPTIEQGKVEQGAEMVGGVLPDIATAIGFSLVGLPTVGVGAVSARQGAQQAGQDFVRAFNDAQENGIDTGGKYPNGDPIIRKATDDEAYEIATKAAGIGFATGAAEGLVGAATGRVGAKLASKAASKATAKAVEKGVDTGLDASIAGTMQVGRNVFDRYQGLNTELGEGVLENMAGEVLLSAPVNTFHGVREYASEKNKDGVKKSIEDIYQAVKEQPKNPYKLQKLQENIEVLKQSGGISEADYSTLKTRVSVVQKEFEAGASLKEAAKVAEREEKKVELTSVIEDGDQALKTVMDAPAETPFEKAQQEVLISKVKESQKAAFEELKTIATEEIDEFERKAAGDNTGVEQQVESTPPDKVEGVGEGAEVKKPSDEQKLQDFQKGDVVTFTYKTKSEIPEVLKDRVSSSGTTNGVETFRVTLPKSEADYLLAQEVKPKTEAPESGSVGVGGDVKVNKKLALENAEKIDNGDGSHVKKMSMQELKELAMDMSENEKEYQEKFEDAQGIYNLTTERIEELEQSKEGSVGVGGDVEAKNKELKNIELGLTDSQHILLASEGEPIATVGNVSKIGVGNDTKIELTKEEQKEVDKYFKAYNKNLIDAADFNKWRKDFSDRVLSRRKAEVEQSLKETTKAETTKKDFEQVKTEKERLKNLVTAIEKKQPYDKKEVDFFSSDQSALFNKSGVPVELQVALEEAKKEPKVETERQATVNKIVEMADEYNSLFQGKRGRATSEGYDLLNRVRQLAADNGFTAAGGTGRTNVTILNKSGNIVRAKYASSSNKDLVEDYTPLSERDEKVQEVFNTLSGVSALALPTVRNAAGARFSKDQMESAVRDILKNKPTAGAKRVLDALDAQVQDGNIRIEDPVMGNMSVSLKDYLESFTEEFSAERAEESRDQAALAKEYETWFNNLTDEEKQNENKYLDAEFDTETESASDVADQTPAVAEIDKASSSNKGDNEKPVSKESGPISEVSTNKSKTDENVKGNKKAERRQKGLLGPGKKFYSYLVSQGMSKASAALNTAVFTFSVARRAAILGKPVSEVMDEYRFGDETQTIRLNDKDVEVKKGQALFQDEKGVRGSWAKAKGQRLLSIYSNAKNTTAVHEALGHDYLDTIIQAAATGHKESSEDIDVIVREYKKDNRNTPTDYTLRKELEAFDVESMDRERDAHAISIHEWFAKKAEEYMANPEMKGASPRLKRLFEKFIIYLRDLHNTLAGKKVSEPMRKIFQKAFGEDYDIAQEAIEKEMEEVSALQEVSTPSDELFNSLLDVSNVLPNDKKLFDAAFDEKKSKETLIALAQKLILEGKAVKDVIPTIKKMVEDSAAPKEQKEFLSKLIDKSAVDMILDPPVQLGDKTVTRRGIQKFLKNPNNPQAIKNMVLANKDILEYKPISFAEGDALADAAIRLYGLDAVDKWMKKLLRGSRSEQAYAPRIYKKILEAQNTLANKYAAEGNETLLESTLENWNLDIEKAGNLSTFVAQQLVMFRNVFGHPEMAVRSIQKELTNVQKVKIAKRDKIREMLKEALDKLEITNEELLQQTFELEETQEQLRDKIVELESETRSRAAAPKSLPKKPGSFENPKQAFEERVAQLKAMRQARGLSDADSEATVLKEATELLFEMDGKAYSFPQYAKKMRVAVDDKLTDQELADAYKAVRDEQGLPLDGDDVIGALLHKKIVKDEELAAAKAEKVAMKSASKAKLAAIAAGKKAVLDKLKDAGFKRGDHVDWRKIATERMQNPDKAAEIINEAIDSVGGLTASEKLGMKLEMLAKLDETIREHKTRLVEQILKDNDVSPNKKNKGDIDKIVALLNTLSDESSPVGFKNALNKLLGIESIPTKDLKRIRELGQALQVEELRMERQAIMNEMYNIVSKYKGGRGARILADFYYANMLSGPITQLKNSTNRFNIWANLMGAYIRSGGDKNLLEVAKNSRNRGILMSTLQRGISLSRTHLGENFYGNSQHVSEFEFFRERNLRDASGKLTIPTVGKGVFDRIVSSPKYVGRSLDGIDGENWIRMYDQAQYRFLVRMFKARGLTTEAARDKAIDIMRSPLGEMEAMERAKKIYSAKKMKVSDATLKRAAYDLIQQAREKQAAGEGIDNLEEIGHALANWITFKGDAYGPTEIIPAISRSTVKGLNYLSEEFGKPENGKWGKAAQFLVNAIRIINIPFVNGVARIVTRGLESALGIGFAKSWYQYSRAKDETGIEREMAVYQAQETLNSAIGSTIAFYAVIHGLVAISQALYDDEDDKWASGFYSRIPSDNPAVKSRPGYALHVFGMWIPFGWLGTFAIPAAVSAAVSDHYRMKKLSGEEQKFMIAVNTINTVLGSSFLQTQNNFKDYVSDVLKGGDVSGKTEEAIIRGSASVTANLIPLKSFFNQVAQMFTNAEDKEARTFVQNIVKYSIGGIGLKPRIDYMGRVVKAGKKNPESAAGVTEMFNEWGYDNRDKMIASFGSDFSLWNRSQKTLYFNDRPVSDEKYYDFQKQANTNFGQYMRYYVNNLRVVSDPKQSMSNKRFRGIIIKELHSLANKKAMSSMFITGENKEIISPEQIEKELSKIDEFFK